MPELFIFMQTYFPLLASSRYTPEDPPSYSRRHGEKNGRQRKKEIRPGVPQKSEVIPSIYFSTVPVYETIFSCKTFFPKKEGEIFFSPQLITLCVQISLPLFAHVVMHTSSRGCDIIIRAGKIGGRKAE